jgi:flavin reductase (DIM6/NTAB) family NADH-FMN oxidoreductase RutF
MTIDVAAADKVLAGLRPFLVAVTAVDGGFANGLMSLSAGSASIVPELPRTTVSPTKYDKRHDMVVNSGVFVMHMLPAGLDEIDASIDIVVALGGSSGSDGDKISQLRTKPGVTGAPIVLDAHSYAECRISGSLDNDGAWGKLPHEWVEQYEANHEPQLKSARDLRAAAQYV